MPLVLSLKTGQDFYVGEEQFYVHNVTADTQFVLRRAVNGDLFTITDERAVEIMADVFVSAGTKPDAVLARLAIEAPRRLAIVRGRLYRGERNT